jgi:hypothetical protein
MKMGCKIEMLCIQSADGSSSLTDEKDKVNYAASKSLDAKRKPMKTKYVAAWVSFVLLLASIVAAQTSTLDPSQFGAAISTITRGAVATPDPGLTSTLYDNFTERFLNPLKWNSYNACYTSNGQEMECVREIQNGHLRLTHRTFGQRDSDSGSQVGSASLSFANPGPIRSITTDLSIRSTQESSCAANPQYLGTRAHIDATFFNAGSGDPSDDVGAQFVFGRSFSDPAGQISVYSQYYQGSNYVGFVPMGTFDIGTPITATVTWDQANHQFIFIWTNDITHLTTRTPIPYNLSDTNSASNPAKTLSVVTFAADCTATADWTYVEATFDNVRISK